jgi:hypothetical protein
MYVSHALLALFTDFSNVVGPTASLALTTMIPISTTGINIPDEEYNSPANGCTTWQPMKPGSVLESKGDLGMDLGGHDSSGMRFPFVYNPPAHFQPLTQSCDISTDYPRTKMYTMRIF